MKTKIIENGIEYVKCGDYYISNLAVPEEQYQIGKYGRLHGKFIKEHYRAFYSSLLIQGGDFLLYFTNNLVFTKILLKKI